MIEKVNLLCKRHIDFNTVSELLDNNNYTSIFSGNWQESYVLNGTFLIRNIDDSFQDIKSRLDFKYNPQQKKANLHLFCAFKTGATSITHKDEEVVYIIGVLGRTMYKIITEEFIVEHGDILRIPANTLHTAISLTPRIVLSYSVIGDSEYVL
jgi:mannose-6-phosphate isomerase-like protein (cupin superfamily)